VRATFGVTWKNRDGAARSARLSIERTEIVLTSLDRAGGRRKVPFDELVAIESVPPAEHAGDERPTLVMKLRGGDEIELRSNVDRWIVADLLEGLFAHGLGGTRRILVAARLKPGAREQAAMLLRSGPPFPPEATPLVLHEVYLLEDEVLFLFDVEEGVASDALRKPDFWAAAGAWRDLIDGEVRLAERVYRWSRERRAVTDSRFGLGF